MLKQTRFINSHTALDRDGITKHSCQLRRSRIPNASLLLALLSISLATPLSALAAPSDTADGAPVNASSTPNTTLAPDPDCPSCALSRASTAMSHAVGMVIEGSITTVGASGMIVVSSIEVVAQGSVVLVRGISDGVSITVQLSANAIEGVTLVSGTVIRASTVATGHLLISAGKVIAFIPNELGKALIHHEKVS